MGGRGTFAIGNMVAYTYETIDFIEGIKILSGLNGKHGFLKKHIQVMHTSN